MSSENDLKNHRLNSVGSDQSEFSKCGTNWRKFGQNHQNLVKTDGFGHLQFFGSEFLNSTSKWRFYESTTFSKLHVIGGRVKEGVG
jgi:hypothetical protein